MQKAEGREGRRRKSEVFRNSVFGLLACAPFAFCLLPSAFPVSAQQVFRSGAQVVEVDARVFDKGGNFLTGLSLDDFEILEDGVPQQLVALTMVGAATSASASIGTIARAEPIEPVEPIEPIEPRQTWIFFFDINHLTPGANFGRARDAAAAFVRDRFQEGDMAGVIDANGMVNGRLTTVREEVVKGIEGVKPNAVAQSRLIQMTREWPRLPWGGVGMRWVTPRARLKLSAGPPRRGAGTGLTRAIRVAYVFSGFFFAAGKRTLFRISL